jgi:hypothetical protein
MGPFLAWVLRQASTHLGGRNKFRIIVPCGNSSHRLDRAAARRHFSHQGVAAVPEIVMRINRLTAEFAAFVLLAASLNAAQAAGDFPFDRMMPLDVAPMRPLKRVPMMTVQENGVATIELWCRTAAARVELAGDAIKIEIAPLPEALPQYMSTGQCSDDRVQADAEMLEALTQATEWRARGDGVDLIGPKPLRFRASSN